MFSSYGSSQLICRSDHYSGFHVIRTLTLNGLILFHWGKLVLNFNRSTLQMKFSFKDFFSKCDQIRSFLHIWAHLLKKFIFCAVMNMKQIKYVTCIFILPMKHLQWFFDRMSPDDMKRNILWGRTRYKKT